MVFMTHNQNPTNPTCASATISQGNLLHGSWEQMSSIKWACWFGSLFFFLGNQWESEPIGDSSTMGNQWEINGIHQQNQKPTNKKGVQRRFHPNQGCKHRRRLVGAIEMRYVWWFQRHFCNSDPWWGWYMTTTIPKWLLPTFNEDYPCAPQHNC